MGEKRLLLFDCIIHLNKCINGQYNELLTIKKKSLIKWQVTQLRVKLYSSVFPLQWNHFKNRGGDVLQNCDAR